MRAKKFLLAVLVFLIIAFSGYVALFYFQLGSPLKAEWWIKSSYQYKDFRAKNIKEKKVIILAGSNSLFGINSELIEQKTGFPVLNLACHAGLDIDYLYYILKKHIKEGDIVVLPLEFEYYSKMGKTTDWFSNNMIAWGKDYLTQLPLEDFATFLVSTEPKRVLEGVVEQIETDKKNKIFTQHEIIKQLEDLWAKEGEKWRGYSFKSLNKFGDINADQPVVYKNDMHYINDNIQVSSHFLDVYKKVNKLVKQYHGTIYLTYPVTLKNKLFDLSQKESQNRIMNLEALLKQHDIDIQCNAALFNLDRVYFFNTHYHPNKYGALIRSENLAECLNKLLNDHDEKISYSEATYRTELLQKKYIDKVKKPTLFYFEKRYEDLTIIKKTLERYYLENGKYPVSTGYDGLYTKWGYEGKKWINGLIPNYIESLPRDPRNTSDASKQYLYKSNGKEYKLIAHNPEDCTTVKAKHPKLIDPKRDCWAYGFWTKDAKNW